MIAEAGGKRILLTGDARGDKIIQGLELVGALKPQETMHVDVLKMPHHGSDRNMETSFLERIIADHYVFSGDGEYGNPERATLEMLLKARGDANYTIHLTYPDRRDRRGPQERLGERAAEGARSKEEEPWQSRSGQTGHDKKNSLTAFFKANPAFEKKVRATGATAPHVIDLLDPVGI